MKRNLMAGFLALCMAVTLLPMGALAVETSPTKDDIFFFINLPTKNYSLSDKGSDYLFLTYGGSIDPNAPSKPFVDLDNESSITRQVTSWPTAGLMPHVNNASSKPVGRDSTWTMDPSTGEVTEFTLNVNGTHYSSDPAKSSDHAAYGIRWAKFTKSTNSGPVSSPHVDGILYKKAIPVTEVVNPNASEIVKVLNKTVTQFPAGQDRGTFSFTLDKTDGMDYTDFEAIYLTATVNQANTTVALDFTDDNDADQMLSPGEYTVTETLSDGQTDWATPNAITFTVGTNGEVSYTNNITTITNTRQTYTVRYDWGTEAPADQTCPHDTNMYDSLADAKNAVDTTFISGFTCTAQKDGQDGTWTFSGWDTEPKAVSGIVTCTGSWTFAAAPEKDIDPIDGTDTQNNANPADDTDTTNNTDTQDNTDSADNTDTQNNTDPVDDTHTQNNTDPVDDTDTQNNTDPVDDTDTQETTITEPETPKSPTPDDQPSDNTPSGDDTKPNEDGDNAGETPSTPSAPSASSGSGRHHHHTPTPVVAEEDITDEDTPLAPVPEMLNGDDHFAYIAGYPDGSVRPNGSITRAEVAMIFYRLLQDDVRAANRTTDTAFADVTADAWYGTAVATMARLGIVTGRSADTFAPNAPITRAEFAAIAARFDHSDVALTAQFSDLDGSWAKELIQRAAALGWVNGYADGSFRPNASITRAESMTLINRVLDRVPETQADLLDGMKTWPDNDNAAWYYLAVQEATNGHDFQKGAHESWTALRETHVGNA